MGGIPKEMASLAHGNLRSLNQQSGGLYGMDLYVCGSPIAWPICGTSVTDRRGCP